MEPGSDTRARSGAPSSLTGLRAVARAAIRERFPDAILTRRLFVRSLGVWVGVRLALQAVGSLPAGEIVLTPMALGLPGGIVMAAVVALLGLVDLVRRNERLLVANLGIRRHTVAAIGALAALVGETLTTLLFGATA